MDTNFHVDFAKRIIVAYTTDVRNEIAAHVILRFPEMSWSDVHNLLKKKNIPDALNGRARCMPGDEWDEEFGRRVAEYRLKQRFARTITRAYVILAQHEHNRAVRLMDFAIKYENSIDEDDRYITQ